MEENEKTPYDFTDYNGSVGGKYESNSSNFR